MKRQPHHIMSFHSSTYSIFGTPWPRITGGELILAANIPQVSYCLGVRILLTFKKQQKNRGLQRLLYDNTGFTWVYMGLHGFTSSSSSSPLSQGKGGHPLPWAPPWAPLQVHRGEALGRWGDRAKDALQDDDLGSQGMDETWIPGWPLMTLMTLAHWTIGGIPCMWWKPWFHWGFP